MTMIIVFVLGLKTQEARRWWLVAVSSEIEAQRKQWKAVDGGPMDHVSSSQPDQSDDMALDDRDLLLLPDAQEKEKGIR